MRIPAVILLLLLSSVAHAEMTQVPALPPTNAAVAGLSPALQAVLGRPLVGVGLMRDATSALGGPVMIVVVDDAGNVVQTVPLSSIQCASTCVLP